MPEGLGGLFESRRCHECVGDACRTGSYRQQSACRRQRQSVRETAAFATAASLCGAGTSATGSGGSKDKADPITSLVLRIASLVDVSRIGLPAKRAGLNTNIGGENHDVRRGDVVIGEHPLLSSGALRFHLYLMTEGGSNLLSEASAAMMVCAMPVGQEVTAMIFFIGECSGRFREFRVYFKLGEEVAGDAFMILISSEQVHRTTRVSLSRGAPALRISCARTVFREPMSRISSMA